MTLTDKEKALAILQYWHNIEFFIPFDLEQIADDSTKEIHYLLSDRMAADDRTALPWLRKTSNAPAKAIGYNLFVGIFDKGEILKTCQRFPGATISSVFRDCEESERADLEGRTCFAKIKLDASGNLIHDLVSVSTFPWAIGAVSIDDLSALNFDKFQGAQLVLQDLLRSFASDRNNGSEGPKPLLPADVIKLVDLFFQWAFFTPDNNQTLCLVETLRSRRLASQPQQPESAVPLSSEASEQQHAETQEGDEEDDEEVQVEFEIDILNSFYIKDIERVIESITRGEEPPVLLRYLMGASGDNRVDLYSDPGRQVIYDMLHPGFMNQGHWLSDKKYAMSLMQQFAINNILKTDVGAIFSVNGPPGTGKTTLLSDIIADNIVQRGRQLAKLPAAKAAFTGSYPVQFTGDERPTWISILSPDITGYEMVAASSNNAAVENISKDLPKKKSLGPEWRHVSYLQKVAHKIAAQKNNDKFEVLTEDQQPWGLISCALGNSRNRRKFRTRFAFPVHKGTKEDESQDDVKFQTFWEWRDNYKGDSFDTARRRFGEADAEVLRLTEEMKKYAELKKFFLSRQDEIVLSCDMEECEKALQQYDHAEASVTTAEKELDNQKRMLQSLQAEERLLGRAKPGFLARLFRKPEAVTHAASIRENAQSQIQVGRSVAKLERQLSSVLIPEREAREKAMKSMEHKLESQCARLESLRGDLANMEERYCNLPVPSALCDLETDDFQKAGLWHTEELAYARSRLFAAALSLHEAWLAEVCQKSQGFASNIVAIIKMLEGKRIDKPEHIITIWKSLFMVVPVVSTTFASFANQFKELGASALGWLFIDEAGQAVPQAAIGALWRAKRAIIVGDPRQIEPVFTVPLRLIEALADNSPEMPLSEYAPNRVSVQRLADKVNPYGTLTLEADGNNIWIGSPLRVHRRCFHPMFLIANSIAYGNKMVYGFTESLPPRDYFDIEASVWLDIKGSVSDRQVVDEQLKYVLDLLVRIYCREENLPNLYVITPFKRIKQAMKRLASNLTEWGSRLDEQHPPPKDSFLKKWCEERIGTVHTFQGKEERLVIMVLGADEAHEGAVAWASSKPNLLNVAVTRAKHRILIIGDAELWGRHDHFKEALGQLENITPAILLDRIYCPAA